MRICNDLQALLCRGCARPSTKEKEQYYFEMFRRDYVLPSGAIEYGDKPDVVLRGEKTIGIEMTNFFLEDGSLVESEQVQRTLRDLVVSEAESIYHADRARRFELAFGFARGQAIRDQNQLARSLANLATRIEAQPTGEVSRDAYQDIPQLSFVYRNAREYAESRWHVSQGYTVPRTPGDRLTGIIRNKEAKLHGYRACDAFWLLLVVDFIDRAQDQHFPAEKMNTISSTVFERILLYKTYARETFEVFAR